MRRPVTIVVPIYDDLEGLLACLRSLVAHVDTTFDRVLLTNDVGPNVDAIEAAVLDLVGDLPGFDYHRNEVNLGFVGNCNHAVLELDRSGNDVMLLNSDTVVTRGFLDEMAAVLQLTDHNGAVAPRSNNATIASIPLLRRNNSASPTTRRTRELFEAVSPLLPRATVAPVAMGFCFLVRRELIDRFGFFDETFAPGYGEENDFCLRINEHGYASVLANRALVYHTGSTSFSGDRGPSLRLAHEKLLIERYPFYVGALAMYSDSGRDPVDRFADAFLAADDVLRIALEVDGTNIAQMKLVETFVAGLQEGAVITVVVPKGQITKARAAIPSARVTDIARNNIIFDVAVSLSGATSIERLLNLNRLAPRLVIVNHDAVRDVKWSRRLRRHRAHAVWRFGRELADAWLERADLASSFAEIEQASRREIDVAKLRQRWSLLVDLASATGIVQYPKRATWRRRAALYLGSKSPRLTARLRHRVRP